MDLFVGLLGKLSAHEVIDHNTVYINRCLFPGGVEFEFNHLPKNELDTAGRMYKRVMCPPADPLSKKTYACKISRCIIGY